VSRAPVAVAVMAKAPGFAIVKSRLQPPLTADEARALATAFLLDRLDGVAALSGAESALVVAPRQLQEVGAARLAADAGGRSA